MNDPGVTGIFFFPGRTRQGVGGDTRVEEGEESKSEFEGISFEKGRGHGKQGYRGCHNRGSPSGD